VQRSLGPLAQIGHHPRFILGERWLQPLPERGVLGGSKVGLLLRAGMVGEDGAGDLQQQRLVVFFVGALQARQALTPGIGTAEDRFCDLLQDVPAKEIDGADKEERYCHQHMHRLFAQQWQEQGVGLALDLMHAPSLVRDTVHFVEKLSPAVPLFED